jgi:hypothetical protein
MEIQITQGQFQIPADFEIEIEETNPLLTTKGSKTIPVTLPGSPHNLAMLGNPERIAAKNRPQTEYKATISEGVFRKTGRQVVFSASKNGIDTAFYFREGDFYDQIKEVTLKEIFSKITVPSKGSVNAMVGYLDGVMKGTQQEQRFTVFPVATAWENTVPATESTDPDILPYRSYIINFVENDALTAQTTYQEMPVPAGYGITVFPYLHWVLDMIFAHFGFTLKPTLWHTDTDFSKLVLLNSTADTIVKGTINFGDVVPSINVSDFLDCICKKFNCAFDIDTDRQMAEVWFLDEVLAQTSNLKDISGFLTDEVEITFQDAKRVRLSNSKGLEFSKPETSTLGEFQNKYTDIVESDEDGFYDAIAAGKTVYRKNSGTYYTQRSTYSAKRVSSALFDFDEGGSVKTESFESKDEAVPVIRLIDFIVYGLKFTPFTGERRHVYTVVEKEGLEEEESVPEQKILFCFAATQATLQPGSLWPEYPPTTWYYGTPFSCNYAGIQIRNTGMQYNGNDGLYERFWKITNTNMKKAYQPIKGIFRFPYKDFLALKFNRLYLLHGQPVIIKSKKYTVKKGGIEYKEIELIKLTFSSS